MTRIKVKVCTYHIFKLYDNVLTTYKQRYTRNVLRNVSPHLGRTFIHQHLLSSSVPHFKAHYIYYDSKLLASVFHFAKPPITSFQAAWAEQHLL